MITSEQRYFFGIDLGTTNSVVACYDAAKGTCSTLIHNYSPLFKSQIWKDYDGTISVGDIPESKRDTVDSIKDVKSSMLLNSGFQLDSVEYTAVDISTLILQELKEVINNQYAYKVGYPITEVTVTVPAAFNNIQRSNTLRAAKQAGLDVISLINEPTSAALAYADNLKKQETVLIYDLGGGTFDVSIVNISPEIPPLKLPKLGIDIAGVSRKMATVLRSDGDTRLGGNDIDRKMVDIALRSKNITSIDEKMIKPFLRAAQHFKETDGAYGGTLEHNGISVTFTDDIYLQATDAIFERTEKIVKNLMETINAISIDRIVFVGGSTKNKYLCNRVAGMFSGIPVYNDINPDECVAIGAAKNSFILSGNSNSIAFTDIVVGTYSIFIKTDEGPVLEKMLLKGEPLPAIKTINVHKTTEDQTRIEIPIYQGDNISYKLNHLIGSLIVDNVPATLSIDDDIPCTMQVTRNGIISATADVAGQKYTTTIDISSTAACYTEEDAVLTDLEDFITNEF